ncbi:MAG: YbfB/YjiJ family MFS transporter [Pseudomonadota bacterium]
MTESSRLWWIVIGLAIGPTVSNGFARFAYGLILPAMRDDLGWTYTQAGWINTANAIGYLLGALLALGLVARTGPRFLFIWGMALTAVALAFSAITHDFWWLSFWRVMAGIGGAPVFIAGGVIASGLFAEDKAKNALAIAVYFGGGGLGMVITGLGLPLFIEWFGDPGWPLVWLMLGVGTFLFFVPSALAAEAAPKPPSSSSDQSGHLPVLAMGPGLVTYFMFGLGYIVFITFLIAWMQTWGAGPGLVAATWAVMGVAVMASPFLWRGVLARAEGGLAMVLTMLATGAGVAIPLAIPSAWSVIASAALFGASFFMVPTSMTAFARKNLPPAQWGRSLSLFTTIFAIGQIIGPVGAGIIADGAGGPEPGLLISAGILILGALIALAQRPLARASD